VNAIFLPIAFRSDAESVFRLIFSSGEFIGCVGIDVSVKDLSKNLDSTVLHKHSVLMLVNYKDGTFVSNSLDFNIEQGDETGHVDRSDYEMFLDAVNFTGHWDPIEAEEMFQSVAEAGGSGLMTAYPIPIIPDEYDPSYSPKFLVVHSISLGVFDVVDYINDSIGQDVRRICILAGGLAVFGIFILLLVLFCVSRMLTRPLLWIEAVSWDIVNHAGVCSDNALKVIEEEEKVEGEKPDEAFLRCAPKTEVNQLVTEFRTMIRGFSNEGASRVATRNGLNEVSQTSEDFTSFVFISAQKALIMVSQLTVLVYAAPTPDTQRFDLA